MLAGLVNNIVAIDDVFRQVRLIVAHNPTLALPVFLFAEHIALIVRLTMVQTVDFQCLTILIISVVQLDGQVGIGTLSLSQLLQLGFRL